MILAISSTESRDDVQGSQLFLLFSIMRGSGIREIYIWPLYVNISGLTLKEEKQIATKFKQS